MIINVQKHIYASIHWGRLKWFNNSHLCEQLLKDKLRETKLIFNKMNREARTIYFNSDKINDFLVSINQSI